VRMRITRQPVRKSKFPVASASGIAVSDGSHLSPVDDPNPLLQAELVVAGRPPYGTVLTPAATGCGGSPLLRVASLKKFPSRNGGIAGIGNGLLRETNGFDSSPATPISCSSRV